jgi:hypothetical protein
MEDQKVKKKTKSIISETTDNEEIPKKRGRKPKSQLQEQKQSISVPICNMINKPILIKLKLSREDTDRINNQLNQMFSKEYSPVANTPTAFNTGDSESFVRLRVTKHTNLNHSTSVQEPCSGDQMCNDTNKIISLPELFSKGVWPEKTNIKCWWCTLSFETVPCFIPTKFHNGKYTILGCFCSFNCAMSYNLYSLDQNQHERLRKCSLLHTLYYEIHGETEQVKEILPAPPKEVMIGYGGKLTIEQYRGLIKECNISSYKIIYPPISGISFQLEDISKNSRQVNGAVNQYVLERSKPPPNSRKKVTRKFIRIVH